MTKAVAILFGMKDICNYTSYCCNRVEYAVEHDGFPAVKTQGRWQSNTLLIDEWQLRIVREQTLSVADKSAV